MRKNITKHPMSKRGQIIELFGVVIIIGIAVIGAVKTYYQKDAIYVGDTNTSTAYKYNECKDFVDFIPKERMVVFANPEKINEQGFKIGSCK